MKSSSTTQTIFHELPYNVFLIVIGIGLILGGIAGAAIGQVLWYWCDFRFWGWWLFGLVMVGGFGIAWRVGGKVKIVGVLVLVGMLVVRVGFDVGVYKEGKTLSVRPGEGKIYDYQLYFPKGFHDLGSKQPLIVFLHGAGEVGIDVDELRPWNLRDYTEQDMSAKEEFPFIVVAPVAPKHGWEPERVVAFVDELVGQVGGRLNIDPDRVYLTGYSMGGGGTFQTACEYPDRFAAIVPVAGYGDPEKAAALQNVPTWAFHGDADDCVEYRSTARMIEKMRILKHPKVKFTTLKGYGHGITDEVYSRSELYRWLLKQKREVP